jgi:hypothetical protein
LADQFVIGRLHRLGGQFLLEKEMWRMPVSSRCGGSATVARSTARRRRPPLTLEQILAWADAHRKRAGDWPTSRSGPIAGVPDVTWWSVAEALIHGYRGLPGGDSLARLLARCRGRHNPRGQPPLSVTQILAWADDYHQCHGHWPSAAAGVIPEAGELTWRAVNLALRQGHRGLPGGSSLSRLLSQHRGKPRWARCRSSKSSTGRRSIDGVPGSGRR